MNFIHCLIFIFSIGNAQNVSDYKKMIEEAIASQQNISSAINFDIRVERVSGDVEVISAGEEKTKLYDNYQYPLEAGDSLKVGYDGEANIYINNYGLIKVTRNSEIEVIETSGESVFSLLYGAIISKIEKLARKSSLKIKTPSAVCGVRGTQFAIEHNKLSGESVFGVIDEGEIEVYPGEEENENNLYKVSKNQEITITPSAKRYKITNLSRLIRHRAKILEIRKRLAQHKKSWRAFNQNERIKYRQKLFNRKDSEPKKQFKRNINKNRKD